MTPETIQKAIDTSKPDEFWEEKVDWQAELPADSISIAMAAVAQGYINDDIKLTDSEASALANHFEANPATETIAKNIRFKAIQHRLGTIVSYSGS